MQVQSVVSSQHCPGSDYLCETEHLKASGTGKYRAHVGVVLPQSSVCPGGFHIPSETTKNPIIQHLADSQRGMGSFALQGNLLMDFPGTGFLAVRWTGMRNKCRAS